MRRASGLLLAAILAIMVDEAGRRFVRSTAGDPVRDQPSGITTTSMIWVPAPIEAPERPKRNDGTTS